MKKTIDAVAAEKMANKTTGLCKPRVRDRIFEAATDLFYRQGINNVGIDAIVCEAGTNKMSLYRNFASKEELVVEYLKDHEAEHWVEWDDVIKAHPDDPRGQIVALFEMKEQLGREKGMCGCPSANAAVELRGSGHPAMEIVFAGREKLRKRLRDAAAAAGAKSPELLGDALVLLLEGGLMSRVTFADDDWPGENLLAIVHLLLDAQLGERPKNN